MFLFTSGTGSHDIDFKKYPIKKNRLFLITPGQVHKWNKVSGVVGWLVLFTESMASLESGSTTMRKWNFFKIYTPVFIDLKEAELKKWEERLRIIQRESKETDAYSRSLMSHELDVLMYYTARLFSTKSMLSGEVESNIHLIQNFREMIDKYYKALYTPNDYAARLNITPNYLNAVCQKVLGQTAGEIICKRIILEAKRQLVHTENTAAEIAYRLNFDDNSYFGRFFKKYVGVTPEYFRKNFNNAERKVREKS